MLPRTDLRTTGASDRRASARFCCPTSAAADGYAPTTEDDKEHTEDEAAEAEVEDGPVAEVEAIGVHDVTDEVVLVPRSGRPLTTAPY